MSKQTRVDKKLEQNELLRARKILSYSQQQKQARKRDRLLDRIKMRQMRVRVPKPARKDRAEIVAKQKKFRSPYGSED